MVGRMRLYEHASAIPSCGLRSHLLRVELAAETRPSEPWIAEVQVMGALPWLPGQERRVRLRIMSAKFREFVVSTEPALLARRGDEIVGRIVIESV